MNKTLPIWNKFFWQLKNNKLTICVLECSSWADHHLDSTLSFRRVSRSMKIAKLVTSICPPILELCFMAFFFLKLFFGFSLLSTDIDLPRLFGSS